MMEHGPTREKKPWPTKQAMEQVYEMNLWGSHPSGFYSGEGSHHPGYVAPYIDAVASFFRSFETPPSVCDLGCGDFNVGKELVHHTRKYVAVDIVEPLVNRNQETFQAKNLEFRCLNIATDDLPSADCAILRQVLQHLSNGEVQQIAGKLTNYNYVIVTEHLPEGGFIPNKEILSGQGTRLKKQSGVDLLALPFQLNVKEETQLLALPSVQDGGVIVTTVYRMV
ncbi:MAG: class I SAM-dependent methyltransferase [Balneolaceae bacterium]